MFNVEVPGGFFASVEFLQVYAKSKKMKKISDFVKAQTLGMAGVICASNLV